MAKHPSQGEFKRVLCVCTGGLLRSPTAAWVLSNPPYNFNTRSCGTSEEFALIYLDRYLIEWADEIVCMNENHYHVVLGIFEDIKVSKPVKVLKIENDYYYRDPALVQLIKERYDACTVQLP